MSKIGRKPIDISGVKVEIKEQEIHFKGPKDSGVHKLPEQLVARIEDGALKIDATKEYEKFPLKLKRDVNRVWGLNRALVANKIRGSVKPFEKGIQIIGLGYKAV